MKKILIAVAMFIIVLAGLSFIKIFSVTTTKMGMDCGFGECYPKEITSTEKVNYWEYTKK